MALLYITEYENVILDARGETVIAPEEPALVDGPPLDFTDGDSHASPVFSSRTRFVMVHPDATCSYVVDASPVATTNNRRMGAGDTRFFGVKPGRGLAVAVIKNT